MAVQFGQAETTGSGKRSIDAGKDDAAIFTKPYLLRIIYKLCYKLTIGDNMVN